MNTMDGQKPLNVPVNRQYSVNLEIASHQRSKEKKFWLNRLAGNLIKSSFPYDYKIEAKDPAEKTVAFAFPEDLSAQLAGLSKKLDHLLHVVLVAGVVVLLQRCTNHRDIIVGTLIYKQNPDNKINNNSKKEYINTVLPLRNRLEESLTFKQLLLQVKETIIEAAEHYSYPMEVLVDDLNLSSSQPGFPLFDVAVVLENIHDKHCFSHLRSNMRFCFQNTGAGVNGVVEYNSALYRQNTIERIVSHLIRCLAQGVSNLHQPVAFIEELTEEEKKQILLEFNDTEVDYPREKNLVELFEEQVQQYPNQPALSLQPDLTQIYQELNAPGQTPEPSFEHLIPRFEKCCFKTNPHLFKFKDNAFLRAMGAFNEREQLQLQLLHTHRENYAAVNPPILVLLDALTGKTNLESLFKALPHNCPEFLLYLITIEQDSHHIEVRKQPFMIKNNFKNLVLLVKALYQSYLLELANYGLTSTRLRLSFAGNPPEPVKDKEKIPPPMPLVTKYPGDRVKAPVLLLGDRTGTATTGLLYMASFLRRHGIEAYCQWNGLKCTGASLKEAVRDLLARVRPKVVGVSMKWFPHIARVLEICKIIKAYDPSIEVVVGGNTASYYSDKIIRCETIDYVIRGDGEIPLLKICLSEEHIPNCLYKKEGKVIENPITYVQDETNSTNIFLSHMQEIFLSPKDPFLTPAFYINTGKGCSQECIYCAGSREVQSRSFNRPRPFLRPVEAVRNDLMIAKQYTARFMFDFDMPIYDSSKYYKKIWEGIDLSGHFCKFYFWKLPSGEFIDFVVRTFKYICLNIDLCSLSQPHRLKLTSLGMVKPQPTDEEIFAFFERCKKYDNVEVVINLITGLPYFSGEDIKRSQAVLSRLIKQYPFFRNMDWGRLHAQPGATILNCLEKYNMYSCANSYEDFLYYSELNMKEDVYPELETFNYPYIYSNDDLLNSKISQYYQEAVRDIDRNNERNRQPLHITIDETYKELNERVNRLVRVLRRRRLQPGQIVGVMVEHSIEMIVGILAVLKTGAAYLPIDPRYPNPRVSLMLKDSNAAILLSQRELLNRFETRFFSGEIIDLTDDCLYDKEEMPGPPHLPTITPRDLAYVIYTSGSTGIPKGVMVEHRSVVRLVKNPNYIQWKPGEKLLLNGSIAFDITTFEIWGPLLNGLNLYLAAQDIILDPEALENTIEAHHITILHLIPQLFKQVAANRPQLFGKLEYLLVGGDVVTPDYVNKVKKAHPQLEIRHMYGPTENTTFSTYWPVEEIEENRNLPIGRPISNSRVYILDQAYRLKPMGVPGELCVGGDGLARGYLNRPQLTAEKFLPVLSRFSRSYTSDMSYIYRTGDLARWLPDGNIELFGRIDNQVKIRGVRVELAEIERRLLKHKSIEAAIVIDRRKEDEKYLCAYLVPRNGQTYEKIPDAMELREYLLETLPDYIIPSYFVFLDRIPLTHNGKVNRKSLPAPEAKPGKTYLAPRGELEKKLARIWSTVLNIPSSTSIGSDDNFFALGGHSLKATRVISLIHKEFNVKLPLAEFFKASTIRELARYINRAAPGSKNRYASIAPAERKEYYALSSAQRRLYVLQLMDLGNTAYNMPELFQLNMEPDPVRLKEAFEKLIKHHESLRTSIEIIGDEPVQRVHHQVEFEIEYYDFQVTGASNGDSIRPFDLSRAPLLRVGLIKPKERDVILVLDVHHIISDAISHDVLMKHFTRLYAGKELPGLRLQYKDYSQWQNREKKEDSIRRQRNYWMKQLEGDIPVLNLPVDYPRPPVQSFEGKTLGFELGEERTQLLIKMTREQGVTLYMLLLALYYVLLFKISSQEDIIVGTPIAGRRHADLEQIVGVFINTLALRNFPHSEITFTYFLAEVKERTLDAFENQDYQFEDLVENVSLARDVSRNPLFDVMFSLQTTEVQPQSQKAFQRKAPGLKPKPYDFENMTAKFDMTLDGVQRGNNLFFTLQYCSKLFKKETVERLIGYFKNTVAGVLENNSTALSEIDLQGDEERKQLLYDFNDTTTAYAKDKTLRQLFEAQVEKTPGNIAVVCGNDYLLYQQLNQKANQAAALLKSLGVKPGSVIGLLPDRSLDMVVGLLGILKSGGAYLPLDPDFPAERVNFMLKDSAVSLLLTQSPFLTGYTNTPGCALINLKDLSRREDSLGRGKMENGNGNRNINQASDLAYVTYTSGSTGKPRGVMIEHRAVVNFIKGITDIIPFGEDDAILSLTTISFDIFGLETVLPLSKGSKVVMGSEEEQLNSRAAASVLAKENVTIFQVTPSRLHLLLEDKEVSPLFQSLAYLLVGGEAFPAALLKKTKTLTKAKIYNVYGPTETTIWSTLKDVSGENALNIGKPLANTRIYILNKNAGLQPLGIPGELCIAGDGLARGYINQPELTCEKFNHDNNQKFLRGGPGGAVFSKSAPPGRRRQTLYKTGDLAKWHPDGNIEFLGRLDHQVKIRGFRIELGEIENLMLKHEAIKEVVVIAGDGIRKSSPGDKDTGKFLCAYFAALKELTTSELREFLARELPGYMIPSYLMQLDKIPLTANGKVNRMALPKPEVKRGEKYVAPNNETERVLAEIWEKVLEVKAIGIDQNFFELGGNSMDIIKVNTQLKKRIAEDIAIITMFEYPTIGSLAKYLKYLEKDSGTSSGKDRLAQYEAKNISKNKLKQRKKRLSGQ